MNRSREHLFHTFSTIDLSHHIIPPDTNGPYRCRVLYGHEIEKIEYLPYRPKAIHTLKLITSSIEYHYKYADRSALDRLLAAHPSADEIILIQNGLVTDCTIANLAFFKEGCWYTPKTPLLEGTMRAKFLENGILKPKDIRKEDIETYTHVALINAMIGFKILKSVTIK
jgi:4-amino-4-deoxychorismate lyase